MEVWLPVAGAIVVALLIAGVAHWRLKRQLAAERERLDRTLAEERERQARQLTAEMERLDRMLAADRERLAERMDSERERQTEQLQHDRERQDAQLAHNRTLADLADLRALLDEAAVALHHADYARADVRQGITMYGVNIEEHRPEAVPALNQRERELDAMSVRLGIRLGPDDPVAHAFRDADEALAALCRAMDRLHEETLESWHKKLNTIEAASDGFEQHVRAFEREAVERAGIYTASSSR
jgi:DNA repair exonuclease SbcCD ATPase subunit